MNPIKIVQFEKPITVEQIFINFQVQLNRQSSHEATKKISFFMSEIYIYIFQSSNKQSNKNSIIPETNNHQKIFINFQV